MDEVHMNWTTWNRESNELNAKLTNIEVELEREIRDLDDTMNDQFETGSKQEDASSRPDSGSSGSGTDLDQRVVHLRVIQERLQLAEASLKSLGSQSERLIRQIASQQNISCASVDEFGQNRKSSASFREKQHEEFTKTSSQFLSLTTSPHPVAVRYRDLSDRTRRLQLKLDQFNEQLDGQLDARDKLFRDLERLGHWLSMVEKRLSKLTRVWVTARSPTLVSLTLGTTEAPVKMEQGKLFH